MSSTFSEIFKVIQQYSPTFKLQRHELSNHAPMTAWALKQLGAHDEDIQAYFTSHKGKLSKSIFINEGNFTLYLGKKEYFYAYYKFFKEALLQQGVKNCITKFLCQLMRGVMTASFHPWIRLSYGVSLLQSYPKLAEKEIVISLAYWSAYYIPFVAENSAEFSSWKQAVEFVCHHIKPISQITLYNRRITLTLTKILPFMLIHYSLSNIKVLFPCKLLLILPTNINQFNHMIIITIYCILFERMPVHTTY